jgi:hypothetical protein
MAHNLPLLDGLLHLASTSHARSVVTVAAVSFAVCHIVVLATAPTLGAVGGNLDAEIPRELVYLAAVLCRFAVPLGVMIIGFAQLRSKSRQTQR